MIIIWLTSHDLVWLNKYLNFDYLLNNKLSLCNAPHNKNHNVNLDNHEGICYQDYLFYVVHFVNFQTGFHSSPGSWIKIRFLNEPLIDLNVVLSSPYKQFSFHFNTQKVISIVNFRFISMINESGREDINFESLRWDFDRGKIANMNWPIQCTLHVETMQALPCELCN